MSRVSSAGCNHKWIHAYSTFGADQGVMCSKCWIDAPDKIYKNIRRKELEDALKRLDQT